MTIYLGIYNPCRSHMNESKSAKAWIGEGKYIVIRCLHLIWGDIMLFKGRFWYVKYAHFKL